MDKGSGIPRGILNADSNAARNIHNYFSRFVSLIYNDRFDSRVHSTWVCRLQIGMSVKGLRDIVSGVGMKKRKIDIIWVFSVA